MPDTVPPEIRGRTTQKRVSSTSMLVRVLGKFRGGDDALVIRREHDALDHADVDVLELDLGLARLQPLAGDEADGDRRALSQDRLHREPAADQHAR